jgi:ribose 5-phosphate isomerase B
MIPESEVRQLVARTVSRLLGSAGGVPAPAQPARLESRSGKSRIIYQDEIRGAPEGGQLVVPRGSRLSPLAGELARQRRVQIVSEAQPTPAGIAVTRTVAIGADHGGYILKENIKGYLAELGFAVTDLGTNSAESVDYPDFAYAVARAVADGSAWRGIMIDGAGIGSAMVANKVPGVRASLCYDVSSASNAREHNDANVLTLGGQLIGPNLARQIVKTWLSTAFGGGRHARRVEKIAAVESRYLKK